MTVYFFFTFFFKKMPRISLDFPFLK